jgi:DNA-binding transcriptional regulator YhcF (GntR family)
VTDGNQTHQPSISIDDLAIALDRDAEIPVGVQLVWALRAVIATADRGAQLPALREIADATGVNVNTIRAVFQRLAREGLVVTRQGAGTFVAGSTRATAAAVEIAEAAAREAAVSGVDPRAVAAQLYVTAQPAPLLRGAAARGSERRRELRLQIAALERMTGEWEEVAPRRTAAAQGAPRLLTEEELEQTRAALVKHLASLDVAADAPTADEPATAPAARKQRATKRVGAAASKIRPATT